MEVGCLLELPEAESLGAAGLLQQCVSDLDNTADEVGQMLMGGTHVTAGNRDCLQSAMDFEFSNSDLETGTDFSMDHASVFDSIAESEIDERGDNHFLFSDKRGDNHFLFNEKRGDNSFLFNDNSILDPAQKQPPVQEIKIHNTSDEHNKNINFTQEGHLNLQIIPLNNLKVVSAINTSDGIQYIALPQATEIQSAKISPNLLVGNIPASSTQYSVDNTPTVSLHGSHSLPLETHGSGISSDNIITIGTNSEEANVIHIEELQNLDGLSFMSQVDSADLLLTANALSDLDESVFHPIVGCDYVTTIVNQMPLQSESSDALFNPDTGALTQYSDTHSQNALSVGVESGVTKPRHMVSLLSNPMVDKLIKDSLQLQNTRKGVSIKFQIETEDGMRAIPTEALPKIKLFNSHGKTRPNEESSPTKKDFEHKSPADCRSSIHVQFDRNSPEGRLESHTFDTNIPPVGASDSESHADSENTESNTDNTSLEDMPTFTCEICNAKLKGEGYFRRHKDLHESRSDCLPDIDVTGSILDIPDIETNNIAMEMSEIIPEVSMTKVNSKQEMEDKCKDRVEDLTLTASLRCDVCYATFTKIGNLTRHKRIHEAKTQDNYRFQCGSCFRKFLQRCDLKRHQLIHSNDLPYLCTKCGKGYIRKSDLVVHERFHTQERGFKCPHCVKSYTQSSDLHRHIRQIHQPKSGLSCPRCKSTFTKSSSLEKHIQTKHTQWDRLSRLTEPALLDGEIIPALTDIDIIDHLTGAL